MQRDWGDRKNRKHARLKYTIEDRGLDAFRAEVEKRTGVKLGAGKAVHIHLDRRPLRLDRRRRRPRTSHAVRAERPRARRRRRRAADRALRTIAQMHDGDFRITPNQNLIIANVPTEQQAEIERIAREAGLLAPWSGLRRNSMACVALPTCGLALAESERYLPELLDRARREARGARAFRRRHRHPHDRLPERLRAALSRRDRLGRQRARAATTSISARPSTARA